MKNIVSASVSDNFELTVSPSEGFTGEHNAEMLEINISSLIQSGYDYYIIIFDDTSADGIRKSNEIRSSEDYPAYLDNETVFCPLSSQLTSTGRLKFQLEAHKLEERGSVIKKTSVACVEFKPSIMSSSADEMDSSSASRLDKLENKIKKAETLLKETQDAVAEIKNAVAEIEGVTAKTENVIEEIKDSISDVEDNIEDLKTVPVATKETVGGIRINTLSPIQLDKDGAPFIDYTKTDYIRPAIKLIFELLRETDRIKTIYVKTCEDNPTILDAMTVDLNMGNYSHIMFCTETTGTINYCDGDFNIVELYAQNDVIYLFSGQGDTFKMTPYNRYSFRKLLLEGVK